MHHPGSHVEVCERSQRIVAGEMRGDDFENIGWELGRGLRNGYQPGLLGRL